MHTERDQNGSDPVGISVLDEKLSGAADVIQNYRVNCVLKKNTLKKKLLSCLDSEALMTVNLSAESRQSTFST